MDTDTSSNLDTGHYKNTWAPMKLGYSRNVIVRIPGTVMVKYISSSIKFVPGSQNMLGTF